VPRWQPTHIRLALGDLPEAAEAVDEALLSAQRQGDAQWLAQAHGAAAWLALERGEAAAADRHGCASLAACRLAGYGYMELGCIALPWSVLANVERRNPAGAEDLVHQGRLLASLRGDTWSSAQCWLAENVARLTPGCPTQDELLMALAGSCSELEYLPSPTLALQGWRITEALAVMVNSSAWVDIARREATRLADSLGASLRSLGQRPPKAPRDQRTLTERESQVAKLIAEGLTNKQISEHLWLSEKTVEMHVAKTMAKLSYHSRARIASWIVEHQRV
jgi:non-specific serine/threonine protein kinase